MNENELDLNLLLVFEAIYSTRNISRAADMLDRSQPAVSNALGRLREQLGDALFVRAGKGVAPTPRAEAMVGSVREALEAIRKGIIPPPGFDPQSSERHFKMIIADPMEPIVLPPLLRSVDGGQISFELQPPQFLNIEEALIDGKTDMAIFPFPANEPRLHCEPLCPLDLVVLARKEHSRINGVITAEDLAREGHITLSLAPGKLANSEKVAIWKRTKQRTVCYVNRLSSMANLIGTTDLIGLVPRIYADYVSELFGFQVLDLPEPVTDQKFFMIWHKRNDTDDGHIWLRHQITTMIDARTKVQAST